MEFSGGDTKQFVTALLGRPRPESTIATISIINPCSLCTGRFPGGSFRRVRSGLHTQFRKRMDDPNVTYVGVRQPISGPKRL